MPAVNHCELVLSMILSVLVSPPLQEFLHVLSHPVLQTETCQIYFLCYILKDTLFTKNYKLFNIFYSYYYI